MMLPLQCHSRCHNSATEQPLTAGTAPASTASAGVKPDFEVLNVFLGSDEDSRLLLARETNAEGQSQMVLQQESLSPHVGWFAQSRITVDDAQAAALKMTLTSQLIDEAAARRNSPAEQQPTQSDQPSNGPRILPFRSSLAG